MDLSFQSTIRFTIVSTTANDNNYSTLSTAVTYLLGGVSAEMVCSRQGGGVGGG